MPKLVTYNTLIRVGQAILTKAQENCLGYLRALTGEFKGYISSQDSLSSECYAGDFYISNQVFSMSFGNSSMGVAKDTIIVAAVDNPNKANREHWIIIQGKLIKEFADLKKSFENHIADKNNPHEVTLIQANGSEVSDIDFQNLLSQV